jgi:hypothetical protein
MEEPVINAGNASIFSKKETYITVANGVNVRSGAENIRRATYLGKEERTERGMNKFVTITASVLISVALLGCDAEGYSTTTDVHNTKAVADNLASSQPTPTDINYSLERYNLIRRAYWVNGQRDKANALICEVEKPLGYIVLFTDAGGVVGAFTVDGKVSSLNSYLTPDSEYYEICPSSSVRDNNWLSDVDGSYGENDAGIFFWTVDNNYIEWTGTYLYTDMPIHIDDPVIQIGG